MNTRRMMMIAVALLVLLAGCTGNTVSWTRMDQTETAAVGPVPGGAPPQSQTQTVTNTASGTVPGLRDLNMPGSVQLPPPALPMRNQPMPLTSLAPPEIGPKLDQRLTDIEARIEELRVWMMRATIKAVAEPPAPPE